MPILDEEGFVTEADPVFFVYFACKRWAADGQKLVFPDSGGYLDQDAGMMLAFEVLEDLFSKFAQAPGVP